MKDYHKILGVDKRVTDRDELKKAFRFSVREDCIPAKVKSLSEAVAAGRFVPACEAYAMLRDQNRQGPIDEEKRTLLACDVIIEHLVWIHVDKVKLEDIMGGVRKEIVKLIETIEKSVVSLGIIRDELIRAQKLYSTEGPSIVEPIREQLKTVKKLRVAAVDDSSVLRVALRRLS